jgi:hypothetical protein
MYVLRAEERLAMGKSGFEGEVDKKTRVGLGLSRAGGI